MPKNDQEFAVRDVLACALLVAGSLVAASACGSFESASSPETPDASAADAADAASADATTPVLDSAVPPHGDVDAAVAAPCPPGATCIGFETSLNDVGMTGDCAIVDTVAHGGAHSAHCKGPSVSYFEVKTPFMPGVPTAFRAFVRGLPPGSVAAPTVGYVGFIDSSLNIPRMMAGDVNARHYDLWWTSGIGLGWISSQVPDGSPSWTCVEGVFSTPSTVTFFVNGTQADFPRIDANLGTAPLSFRWGLPYMQNPDLFEVYVDDIAIGSKRIGCE